MTWWFYFAWMQWAVITVILFIWGGFCVRKIYFSLQYKFLLLEEAQNIYTGNPDTINWKDANNSSMIKLLFYLSVRLYLFIGRIRSRSPPPFWFTPTSDMTFLLEGSLYLVRPLECINCQQSAQVTEALAPSTSSPVIPLPQKNWCWETGWPSWAKCRSVWQVAARTANWVRPSVSSCTSRSSTEQAFH